MQNHNVSAGRSIPPSSLSTHSWSVQLIDASPPPPGRIEHSPIDLYVSRHFASLATAPATAPSTPAVSAPAPSPGSLNITGVLDKAGQFSTFITLLKSTQVGSQLQIQVNSSQQGITIFAPSDSAFAALRPGALNMLTDQQKMALLQYHVLPSYYTFSQFQTLSNPLRTLASGNGGNFYLNVTAFGTQVNMTTGVVSTAVANAVYSQKPIAVYQVDKVLLPADIFGAKPPAEAPAPESGAPTPLSGPTPSGSATSSTATSGCNRRVTTALSSMAVKGLFLVSVMMIWL
eukprot:Gb_01998 [translate_table: standard]